MARPLSGERKGDPSRKSGRGYLLTALLIALTGLAGPARADLTIAADGTSRYVIACAPDASVAVKHVADELSSDLSQMCGVMLPVVTERPKGPAIYVGQGSLLNRAFPGLHLNTLPAEGFVIRTGGPNLALAGHDDRGTVYAVYSFLEDELGARWYAPDATVLPPHPTLQIPRLNLRESPAFDYRDTDEHIVSESPEWDAHIKLDGTSVPARPELGSINRLFNGAENFYELVPPDRYFATHPEYYSLIGGKRTATGDSQLCLTNPDVLRIVTEALIQQAKADPNLLTLGFSPNDAGDGQCQCDNCKASDARYGAPSGTLLHFVNQVAAGVQAAFPGRKLWVETLAYQYTQKAPTAGSIQPAENVLVCLAPIHACDGHPLFSDPPNKESNTALLAWSKVAPGHLQVWHYVTNFANYMQPYPDWDELGADMMYYRKNGVSGMFCEGDYNGRDELMGMRTWVMAHLFWNPRQDVWQLIRDYTNGYYGAAGPDIYAYVQLYHQRLQQPDVHLYLYDPPTAPYLDDATLASAEQLLDHAAAAANTPELKDRVEEVRLGVRYVRLMREVPGAGSTAEQKARFADDLHVVEDDVKRFKVEYSSEGRPASDWMTRMEAAAR